MNLDLNEFEMVISEQKYIDETARSRKFAVEGNKDKIVDKRLVEFYSSDVGKNDHFGEWLSNCMYAKVVINNIAYPSSEHYYQMQKFVIDKNDPHVIEWCRKNLVPVETQIANNKVIIDQMALLTPFKVARFGQTMRQAPIRGDWEKIKIYVMYDALIAKFTQNEQFANALKNTGDAVLVERAPADSIWAINNKGRGKNWLGILLMIVRSYLE